MPRYLRAKIKGSIFFFTVVLAERPSALLVDEIDRLRQTYRTVQQRRPFETVAICVLPDHIHAVWALPEGDSDFSTRWSLIKSGFSRGLDPRSRSASKVNKREKGIWQRRYWEHAIRDDADLERHVDYTHFNPVKQRAWPIGRTAAFIAMLNGDFWPWTGEAICATFRAPLANNGGHGAMRLCPPYGSG